MSDWWDAVGNMASFFPDHPALAVDMAVNGANPNHVGYGLAYGIQVVPETFPLYPDEEQMPLDPQGGVMQ